ncbi:hypothetical protein HMPREF0789_1131, partial [Staphylococcus epidermidis BCM-HMP0060]
CTSCVTDSFIYIISLIKSDERSKNFDKIISHLLFYFLSLYYH